MAKILQEQEGILDFEILVGGAKIKDVVEVCEIFVQREVNKIAFATVEIVDGGAIGAVNEPFTNSEGGDFLPGNEIEIKLGYGSKREIVFKGIILSQRLKVNGGRSRLVVKCKDKAVKMTHGRFNTVVHEEKDDAAIKRLANKYGLPLKIPTSTIDSPILMQYNCRDWDFVVIRAEMNNMVVLTQNNSLIIKKIDFGEAPKFRIETSQYVIDIDLDLDSEMIAESYKMTAWDDKEQKPREVSVAMSDGLSQGNLSAKKLSGIAHNGAANHFSPTSLSEGELKSWGNVLANKAVLSKIQGSIVVPGTSGLECGDMIEISGFSKRFNGKAFISKVTHEVKDGEWLTTVFVGYPPKWQSALPDVGDMAASGLIPAASGTQIAKVKKIDEDPNGNYRVLINFPTLPGNGQSDGVWARLALPYASAEAGFFFFPEIDDEVLVTFINNDPRFPVITGALYSAKNKPKEIPDDKNQFKAIHSKSGIRIRFDDEDKVLILETPGENTFTLDDKEKCITLTDITGNTMVLNDSGVAIESAKDMKLSAKGNVDISATGSIGLNATSDVKADGANIQLSAKTSFTAKGNASAEISASGQTTVKGAMVMIN